MVTCQDCSQEINNPENPNQIFCQSCVDQNYNLITRNLAETLGDLSILKKILSVRRANIYWGTAPTGRIHIGYFIPMLKIVDLLKAKCNVIILIADLHAYLDSNKSQLNVLEPRTQYYMNMIQAILQTFCPEDAHRIRFVKGRDYQLQADYTMDMYKLYTMANVSMAKHAGAEVVKQSDNPPMTGLLYPGLQALDEEYLKVDIQMGGVDQRKIFAFARKMLPKLGYKKRMHLMNGMVTGIRTQGVVPKNDIQNENNDLKDELLKAIGDKIRNSASVQNITNDLEYNYFMDDILNRTIFPILDEILSPVCKDVEDKKSIEKEEESTIEKMSASNENSKIDLLDSKNSIKKKINQAYCLPGEVEDNSLMEILEKVIFPVLSLQTKDFIINRPDKYGGPLTFKSFPEVKRAFANESLHPGDFKQGIWENLNDILEPIRSQFTSKDMKKLLAQAYS